MKIIVDNYRFKKTFEEYGRDSSFTDEALDAMFDYYQEYEASTGDEIEFDCIACCCEWIEYTYDELVDEYGEFCSLDEIIDALEAKTTVIRVKGGHFLIMAY